LRGYGRNGKNNTQATGKAIQLLLHGIGFVSEQLELLEKGVTASADKPVSILHAMALKYDPSFLIVCSVLV